LLSQPEATELIVLSLQDAENMNKAECITLRQAFVLLSKGFFCRPKEVGMITELHLKVVCAGLIASHLFNFYCFIRAFSHTHIQHSEEVDERKGVMWGMPYWPTVGQGLATWLYAAMKLKYIRLYNSVLRMWTLSKEDAIME